MGVPLLGRNALQPQLNKAFACFPVMEREGILFRPYMRVKRVPLTNSGALHVATCTEFRLCFNVGMLLWAQFP